MQLTQSDSDRSPHQDPQSPKCTHVCFLDIANPHDNHVTTNNVDATPPSKDTHNTSDSVTTNDQQTKVLVNAASHGLRPGDIRRVISNSVPTLSEGPPKPTKQRTQGTLSSNKVTYSISRRQACPCSGALVDRGAMEA